MGVVLKIDTKGTLTHTLKTLKGIHHNIPRGTREGIRKWGKKLERDTTSAAMNAPNTRGQKITPMTGNLFRNIQWRQGKKSNWGGLFVPHYGVLLDSMRPHFVSIKPSRSTLMHWALRARYAGIRKQGRKAATGRRTGKVYVRPHPFIRRGYNRARPKLGYTLKKELDRSIKASKR